MDRARCIRRIGLLALVLMTLELSTPAAHAAYVSANLGRVRLYVYSTFGNGDVAFYGTPAGSCVGFWLRPTDPGFKNMYAVLLAARAADRPVQVWGYDDQVWTGSTGTYCRVDTIDFAD